MIGKIKNHTAPVTFKDLPAGEYAVNILHDEDNNSKIKKELDFQIISLLQLAINPIFKKQLLN